MHCEQTRLRIRKGDPLRLGRSILILTCGLIASMIGLEGNRTWAQSTGGNAMPPPPHAKEIHLKHVLVIGETKGFEHDSISDAMAAVYNMGKESGLWDTTMRTDTDRKSTRLNSSHLGISYAVFCLK